MSAAVDVAIVVHNLGEHWLGGLNYYRNLVAVFDAAAPDDLRLHVLTDDPGFLGGMTLSPRTVLHELPMLRRKTAGWALRKALEVVTGRDLRLISQLKRLKARCVLFKYVPGSGAAGIPTLPWIPDFQSQHHPELFPPALVAVEKRYAALYVQQADGLILSSQAASHDAVQLFGADPARLHVLRFAPKLDFAPLQSAALRDEVFARYQVTRPYVFLPNQYWQHKNHRVVAEAMGLLREQGTPMPLVLSTGKTEDPRSPAYFGEFQALLRAHRLEGDYRILGVIPRQDMMVLLAHSLAVLNPSRFEGWSTTVEEAKALGKPLRVSDIAVHREQVAGLADVQLFGTSDAATLARLLADLQRRHGHEPATAHPPQPDPTLYAAFTAQYLDLIRKLAGAPGGAEVT